MAQTPETTALVWHSQECTYAGLLALVDASRRELQSLGIGPGNVVCLEADYSPRAVAFFLALADCNAIVVPLTASASAHRSEVLETAEVETSLVFDDRDGLRLDRRTVQVSNPLTRSLIEARMPGLVLFSSGSTGKSKAALHNLDSLLEKFHTRRPPLVTMTFLLLDHIGGINTLLHVLSNNGTVVTVQSRDVESVCRAIQDRRVELLPTSPAFLNLLLMSDAWQRHDMSSLKRITYGTEVMPESTLQRLRRVFPNVQLQQTYGLSELGILRSRSREPESLWLKVGGEGFETKIVGGELWIRAKSAMLGYLNAPSPFDAEGWMNTQDAVEVDGEYIRILGRKTDMVNVGGQKVYPAEVESVLMQAPNITDATAYGEPNAIMGSVVAASVQLASPEDPVALRRRLREFCRERLAAFKIPVRFEVITNDPVSSRFKKTRLRRA
jgi:acyl-CoA synthetase (AMP-forming)/AMP-acid ligase II